MTATPRTIAGTVAAALLLTGALAACSQTVEGTATRAGNPDSTAETRTPATTRRPSTTSSPRTTSPRSTSPTAGPSPSAPGDPMTMTCSEYNDLDPADKSAVIDAILADESSVFGPENVDVAKSLADAMCQFLGPATLSEILLGKPPP